MNNKEIADTFEKVADMLAIRGDQIHRILAYRRAAESIRSLSQDLRSIRDAGDLTDIAGIGSTLAAKIGEMLDTGGLEFYNRLSEVIPPSLVELLRVEGLGPKRVKEIYERLGVTSLDQLKSAADEGKLAELPGMGKKSQEKILQAIDMLDRHGDDRTLLGDAWPLAEEVLAHLMSVPGVTRGSVAGSLRRMRETIGDIDILVASEEPQPVMDVFKTMKNVETVLGSGPSKTTVVLLDGRQVDLRVLPVDRWGTLLAYFTGSKNHNVRLREIALKQGLSLSEHAFSPTDGGPEILCATEEKVYTTLGLPYVPPTLREDWGEIEAAQANNLPELVELADIRGDLHMHSNWSDGQLSMVEMVEAAIDAGYAYLAITDHSASLGIANGLSPERLIQQAIEIREISDQYASRITIWHGSEVEIKANGELDYPDDVLEMLDLVIASIHTSLRQSREEITRRLTNAIANPSVDIIAHPTGRLMPDRPGADLDMETVFQAALQHRKILEINASPYRLDLRDTHVRRAVEMGVKLAINTDAHHSRELSLMHYGVATAQRGWATSKDIVNCWSASEILEYRGKHT